jgi:hypothetical protein
MLLHLLVDPERVPEVRNKHLSSLKCQGEVIGNAYFSFYFQKELSISSGKNMHKYVH